MEYKSSTPQTKAAGQGKATVVIATLGVKDRDGDVLLKGVFGEQVVSVVPAHDWKSPAIGKARIRESGNEAIADIDFYLSTEAGKNWYNSIKEDFDRPPPKQEYSWGFSVGPDNFKRGQHNGEDVRFLKAAEDGTPIKIYEVSPCLVAAGQNTRSLSVKEQESRGMDEPEVPVVESAVETPQVPLGDETLPSVEDYKNYPEDRRPPLPVLITWLRLYRYHMPFLQDIRKRDHKEVSSETISEFKALVEEMLEVCTQFNIKLMRSHLMPTIEEEELTRQRHHARYQELSAHVTAETELATQQLQAQAEELARSARARGARMKEMHL